MKYILMKLDEKAEPALILKGGQRLVFEMFTVASNPFAEDKLAYAKGQVLSNLLGRVAAPQAVPGYAYMIILVQKPLTLQVDSGSCTLTTILGLATTNELPEGVSDNGDFLRDFPF